MARFPRQQLYIDGAYVDASGGDVFESVNPANGEVLAEVAQATRADLERAVNSAEKGQKVWASMTGCGRRPRGARPSSCTTAPPMRTGICTSATR